MSTVEETMGVDDLSLLVELVRFLGNIDKKIKEGYEAVNASDNNAQNNSETTLDPVEETHRTDLSCIEPCSSSTAKSIPRDEDDLNSTLYNELASIFGEQQQTDLQSIMKLSLSSDANDSKTDKSRETESSASSAEIPANSDVRRTHDKKKNKRRKMKRINVRSDTDEVIQ